MEREAGLVGSKSLVWLGVGIGSTLGGLVPALFGAGYLSMWSIVTSSVGGLLGVWAGIKISNYL